MLISINVGGTVFTTTKATLLKLKYFQAILNEPYLSLKDKDGNFFVDRDPKLFEIILRFLRQDSINSFHLYLEQFDTKYKVLSDT